MSDFDRLRKTSNRSQQGPRPKFANPRMMAEFGATMGVAPKININVKKQDYDAVKLNFEDSTLLERE